MGDLTNDFSRREFACKCGCGYNQIDPRVVFMAQLIRDALGQSVRVNSACRCAKHNAAVGGVGESYHTTGLAADLSCGAGSKKLYETIKQLYERGKLSDLQYCKRYVAQNFVHVDVGKRRVNRFAEA
jgi:uncharacterized protein YcbK (DUF882 family)